MTGSVSFVGVVSPERSIPASSVIDR